MLTLFPDTNFLMECKSLPELPWSDLVGLLGDSQHVRIVLGRSVVREVDRFKSDGKARRSRRARKLSSGLFRQLLEARGQPVVLRESSPKVDVVLSGARPDSTTDLDLSHPDERIVGEAVAHGRQEAVTFFSHDTLALHTANAQGLQWLRIPDEWLAEPEADPRQKQVEELERRVCLLEGGSPAIEFAVERRPAAIRAVRYAALPESLIAELVEDVKKRFPVELNFNDPLSLGTTRALGGLQPPKSWEIEDYLGAKYPTWIQSVEQRLAELSEQLSAQSRCAEISIDVANTGGASARDVQLEFWLSDGLSFLHPPDEARRCLGAKPLPNPPKPPAWTHHGDHLRSLLAPQLNLHARYPFEASRIPRRDPHAFYYKPVPAFSAPQHILECAVFRHRVEQERFSLLVFAEEDVTGGKLMCRVTASNLPEPAVAEFPIVVSFEDGDAAQTARDMVARIGCEEGEESSLT